tara:strand:+ start:6481 stop:7233 length:753 start_codon:yes stop_codon:yes gene_type:complete
MKLSVNLNKIALLRNSRGSNQPNLLDYASDAIDLGVDGLTLHPRPDLRHATPDDIFDISSLCKKYKVEFNLEGNPFSKRSDNYPGFIDLVSKSLPHQVTLVPDNSSQLTSDHGWKPKDINREFSNMLVNIPKKTRYISVFVDIDFYDFKCFSTSPINAIEIYTGPFADAIKNNNINKVDELKNSILRLAEIAKNNNFKINAGHDINLNNLHFLKDCGLIDEVSIGHAIITDSLRYGYKETIKKYLEVVRS